MGVISQPDGTTPLPPPWDHLEVTGERWSRGVLSKPAGGAAVPERHEGERSRDRRARSVLAADAGPAETRTDADADRCAMDVSCAPVAHASADGHTTAHQDVERTHGGSATELLDERERPLCRGSSPSLLTPIPHSCPAAGGIGGGRGAVAPAPASPRQLPSSRQTAARARPRARAGAVSSRSRGGSARAALR
jgi:hypothetical protein